MNLSKFFFILFLSFSNVKADNEEFELRKYLFEENPYNKNVRPIKNSSSQIEIQQGIAVQTLESFNQIDETLSLNLWVRTNWHDDYLKWNDTNYTLDFLSVSSDEIWTPDIELLNSATKPEIYTLKGGINLYNDGDLMYSKPGIYKFSCSLDLTDFPFDKQNCTMTFGSWVYNDIFINLIPNKDESKRIDVLDSFSHSEWKIVDLELRVLNEERECCPDENFNILSYSFILQRYPHYYKISMGMTITLVVVSFIITLMSPDNVSRTSTAVFIPLTILALQLTIANKIPVVGYYTLMDKFFLCCFVTSMICSIESGLIYAVITTNSPMFYDYLDKNFKFELCSNDKSKTKKLNKETDLDSKSNSSNSSSTEYNEEEIAQKEFIELEEMVNREENINMGTLRKRRRIDDDVTRVIDFDDKRFTLTERQLEIENILRRKINKIDTIVRIILPIVFFSLIIYFFSYEEK
jgi:hypothetical protein